MLVTDTVLRAALVKYGAFQLGDILKFATAKNDTTTFCYSLMQKLLVEIFTG